MFGYKYMFFRRKNFERGFRTSDCSGNPFYRSAAQEKDCSGKRGLVTGLINPATRWPQIKKLLSDRSFDLPGLILQVAGVGVSLLTALVPNFPPIIGCLLDQRNGITTAGLADNGSIRRWGLADIEV